MILLFEFIDWVMSLPKELEKSLRVEIEEIEEEMKMEYITSIQRIGREEGLEEGSQEEAVKLLCSQISKRFRIERQSISPIFEGLTTEQIEKLALYFLDAESLDDIRKRADEMREAARKS